MTLCTITGWQCHCQPPEIPCDGLKELREAYADWRRKAEQAQRELSLAEEGLANYALEVEQLKAELHRIRNQSLEWAMTCPHDCPACEAMYEAIKSTERT